MLRHRLISKQLLAVNMGEMGVLPSLWLLFGLAATFDQLKLEQLADHGEGAFCVGHFFIRSLTSALTSFKNQRKYFLATKGGFVWLE